VGAVVLKTGSILRIRKIVNTNPSGKKLTMPHFIRCILQEFPLKYSKKLRKIEWKRELGKIDYA
jgi:hypothetical protein